MSGQDRHELARQLVAEALTAADTIEESVGSLASFRNWASFRSKMEQAYQASPENEDAAWYYGRKLARDGEYQEAIKVLQPLWEHRPDPWSGLTLAWCHDYLGRREKAFDFYARVGVSQFLSETQRRIAAAGIEAPRKPKARPAPPKGLVELTNTGWSATASHEDLSYPVRRGVDGDVRTCWSPGGDHQTPDMWYRIDLGEEVKGLAGIWTDDDAGGESIYQNAAPRRCLVSVSRDGEWWKRVGEYRWSPNTYMEAWWEPVSTRYVLMEQTEHVMPEWWCIYEVRLFQAK